MDQDDIDAALEKLSKRVESVRTDQARKQAAAEHQRDVYAREMAALAELGCNSVEEAEEEIARLDAELDSEISNVKQALQEAEA